jgi:RHS repeat-associated protein
MSTADKIGIATMKLFRTLVCLAAMLSGLAAQAGTVTYYHNDIAGSPVVATDAARQVIWRESYRPYGERLTNAPASVDNKVWFTSRRQDVETGLVYMGARYYDPIVGRFISRDPVEFDERNLHSHNRYVYANNNPFRYVDPDGRMPALALAPVAARFGPPAINALITLGGALGIGIYNATHSDESKQGQQAGSGEQKAPADEGCVYCVKGDKTSSGRDYVGSSDNLDQRKKDTSDGRNREGAEVVDTYEKGDRDTRRAKEQKAINDRGGVDKLDNRRNEIAPKKWPEFGVDPPK